MREVHKLSSVSQTLVIPLAARAAETQRANPVVYDAKAVELMGDIEIGHMVTDGGRMSSHGILARTKVIDEELQRILSDVPDVTIINIGAGLDTRISRFDNGMLSCYDVDLPDVIALRRQYFAENKRIHYIAKSVFDDSWVEDIERKSGHTLIIAEGVLMYFSKTEIEKIFGLLAQNFPGAHMYFDVVHSLFVGRGISSPFLWGLDRASEIEGASAGIKLIQSWSTGDLLKERQPFFLRLMNVVPSTKNRSQILHVQFANEVGR